MPPAEPLMDIDPGHKAPHAVKTEAVDYGSVLVKSELIDNFEKSLNEQRTLFDEQNQPKDPEDAEVDIITYKNIDDTVKDEDPDATEYSSSFADTHSDTNRYSGLSENEVESQFFGDSDLPSSYDPFGSTFLTRKKKLTNHWRSFIRPLMWRCKWAELKIKEIESRARKYAKELASHEQRKHSHMYRAPFEGFSSKYLPFSNQCYRRKAIKRRKRKKIEDAADTSSYMLQHSLFSYLENKKSSQEGSSVINDFDDTAITERCADCNDKFGIDDDQLSFEFEDGAHSMDQVLLKIEIMQTRIHKMKGQIDGLISTHASKFSSCEDLSLLAPCDGQTSSGPSPTVSAGNGETTSVGALHAAAEHFSGYDIKDLVMPDSTMSSYAEAIHVPDIIESTVGLLSAADVTFLQPQIGDSCEDILDNVLIHTEATEGERDAFVGTSNEPLLVKHPKPEKVEEEESINPCPTPPSEPDSRTKITVKPENSVLKSCLASDLQFPNKRKRAERKAGSGGWNKKGSSEPDSQ